jgi:hypothetical protein
MAATDQPFRMPAQTMFVAQVLALVGAVAAGTGFFLDAKRIWVDLFLVGNLLVGLGLGALVLVALFYVTGARWSNAIRRVPEAMAMILPLAAVIVALVLVCRPSLYAWYTSGQIESEESPLMRLWLTRPFFLIRSVIYLALWIGFALALVSDSRRKSREHDPVPSQKSVRLSAGFLVVFGITCWLSSHDWIMSLEPKWTSTVFGVYYFASLFLSSIAVVILLVIWLQRHRPSQAVVHTDHLHDLGTLLFGFSCFWMYVWFCQYMLIWFVDNPEETTYLRLRWEGTWPVVMFLDLALSWGIPFVVLLFRSAKRNPAVLGSVALIVLAGRCVDLWLMIGPSQGQTIPGLWELGILAGAAGLFVMVFFRYLGQAPLVPLGVPTS